MANAKCTCHFHNNNGFKWHLQMKFSRGPIFMTIVAIYRVEICYCPVIISYVNEKIISEGSMHFYHYVRFVSLSKR